jgi:hypothetical protein
VLLFIRTQKVLALSLMQLMGRFDERNPLMAREAEPHKPIAVKRPSELLKNFYLPLSHSDEFVNCTEHGR